LLDYVEQKLPDVFEHLDRARADLLSFTAFPKEIWTQIWSKNPTERLGPTPGSWTQGLITLRLAA
jgi:transposase-like protein